MEQQPSIDKVLLIDKPLEWTSFDVIRKLRGRLKMKKIGHAGTLDPLATGLLIVCTGKMTKQIEQYQAQEKEYTGCFVIGSVTESHDLEKPVTDPKDISHITPEMIYNATKKFTGTIEQIPPMHSAVLVNGQRAYDLARKGATAELKSRSVTISEFQVTAINLPQVRFKVVCTKGTYIRSLARDFGDELGVGAYLSELCRTRIGQFKLEDAQRIEDIAAQ